MSNRPKFTAAILAFFLIICFTFSWLFSHVFSENARFENFAESIFEKEVSGNALNLHYSLAYPEKQGISRTRATLGTIHPNNEKASAQCQEYVKKLKKFSQSKLSTSNRLTLDLLLLYYHTEASLGDNYLLEEPLSPSLGIQAQLPVLLAEYSFYTNQDITDYLNLLCSTKEYFQSILAFEQTKSDAGFFMCDETLERIQDQCRAFIQNPDSNYMLEIFSQKLKNYGKLDLNNDGVISYVMFKGQEGNMEAIARTKYGVEDANAILKAAGKPELKFYDSANKNKYLVDQDGLWSSAAATNYMSTALAQYTESNKNMIELVIANNDEMALGAISALQTAGYNKDGKTVIPVFGVDATDAAKSAIKSGSMIGTIKQDAEGMATAITTVMKNLLNGTNALEGIDSANTVGTWRVNIPYSAYTSESE